MTVFLVLGSLLAFLSVAFGAFASHALARRVSSDRLAIFQTGSQYQMYHAFALIATGLVGRLVVTGSGLINLAGWLFLIGVVLFSGSLYLLTLTGVKKWGAVTPLGGLCFLAGWACFLFSFII